MQVHEYRAKVKARSESPIELIRQDQIEAALELAMILEPVWSSFMPEGPVASGNGNMPASSLASIGHGYFLTKEAAESFNAMSREAERRFGTPILVRAAYRNIALQWYFWNLYRSGRGNLAAYPGTSNHGWGLAVDLYNQRMRWIVDQIGAKYGWAKRWSDAPSEWWHIKFNSAVWRANRSKLLHKSRRTLRRGMSGRDVAYLKKLLRALGFNGVDKSNKFGPGTQRAVKRFQKKHNLHVDGVVGPTTWKSIYSHTH